MCPLDAVKEDFKVRDRVVNLEGVVQEKFVLGGNGLESLDGFIVEVSDQARVDLEDGNVWAEGWVTSVRDNSRP